MTTTSQQAAGTDHVVAVVADSAPGATHCAAAVKQEVGAKPDGLHEVRDRDGEQIAGAAATQASQRHRLHAQTDGPARYQTPLHDHTHTHTTQTDGPTRHRTYTEQIVGAGTTQTSQGRRLNTQTQQVKLSLASLLGRFAGAEAGMSSLPGGNVYVHARDIPWHVGCGSAEV